MAVIAVVARNLDRADAGCLPCFEDDLRSRGHQVLAMESPAEAADWMIEHGELIDIIVLDGCVGSLPGIKISDSGKPGQYNTSHPIDVQGVLVEEQLEQLRDPANVWSIEHKHPTRRQVQRLREAGVDIGKGYVLPIWSLSVNSREAILARISEILESR